MNLRKRIAKRQVRLAWLTVPSLCVAVSALSAADTTNSPAATPAAPAAPTAPADTNAAPAKVEAPAAAAATNAPAAKEPETKTPEAKPADAKASDASETETAAAAELTPEQLFEGGTNAYKGWIEFGAGGSIISGNKGEFRKQQQMSGGAFGGIEDFHYQGEVAKDTTLAIDGHSIFDDKDYKLSFDLRKEKLGYVRLNVSQFRTWYDGDGGFYRPANTYYSLSRDALGLDRGEISFETGLTLEKYPKVTFKYTHAYRDGEKDSTSWGLAHPPGSTLGRSLSPAFYDLKEHSDTFQLDIASKLGKTDVGGGVRYEFGRMDDARKITQAPGEPVQQDVTDRQVSNYDMFSAHAFTETWLKKNVMLSTGFLYTRMNDDFSGNRIYGNDFDVGFVPNALNGLGYNNLVGGSRIHEYVMDLNLFYQPTKHFTVVPSVRVQKEVSEATSGGDGTFADVSPAGFVGGNDSQLLDVRERLDLRYNGVTNWVFWGRGDVTEGTGNVNEFGGLSVVNGIPPVGHRTEDERLFQKYSLGARWYPAKAVVVDTGGYYKHNAYDYNHLFDTTPNTPGSVNRYPAYLTMQDFDTYDGNFRLTLRPRPNLTFVTRYEYQYSTINTAPDPASGLPDSQSAAMTSHIFGEDVSWAPCSRLYLQAGFSYVLSDTKTPANDINDVGNADIVRALLKSQNNYWTLNASSGIVLDKKTDLNLGYFYYQADNYEDNSLSGVPYGSGAQEHGVTATVVRRLTQNIRLKLRYGFSHYSDTAFGGHRDYDAHTLFSSLQYRF